MMLYPKVVTGPDGKPCTTGVSIPVPAEKAEQEKAYAREQWELLLPGAPLCPDQPGVPAVSPRVIATSFWQNIPLPKPQPHIAPGWAITGKTAFLETHGERQHDYSRDTPFGGLGLTARGQYFVDWGDGETTGPYDVEGGAWPDGQITHTYINVGLYNVVVTEQWSSTWHLGGENGTLTGLETEGGIDNFRVEQIQAVVSGN